MEKINEIYFDKLIEFGRLMANYIEKKPSLFKNENKQQETTLSMIDSEYSKLRNFINNSRNKIQLEKMIKKYKLSDAEIKLLYFYIYKYFYASHLSTNTIMDTAHRICKISRLNLINLLSQDGNLIKYHFLTQEESILDKNFHNVSTSGMTLDLLLKNKNLDSKKKLTLQSGEIPSIDEIKSYLKRYVIGQDRAIDSLAPAVYRHLLICQLNSRMPPNKKTKKANILLIGPTGSGKTYLCKLISEIIKVPFVKVNATQYTETGYVGMDVENMIVRLYEKAGKDEESAKNGIIFIDEIDKIAGRNSGQGHYSDRDVSGLSVQEELLKLFEDDEIYYTKKNYLDIERKYRIDNVLFIAGGAFFGIDEIIKKRLKEKRNIGFASDINEAKKEKKELSEITMQDIQEYGFIPEFLGRFGNFIKLSNLSVDDLKRIITDVENSPLEQYNRILEAANHPYRFTEKDAYEIAKESYSLGTGARGINNIMEERLNKLLSYSNNDFKKLKEE